MKQFPDRHAISRAWFFLGKAQECSGVRKRDFESYLEASIIFARAAIHRSKTQFENQPNFESWWNSLLKYDSVKFFRDERNWILKEAPPKIGQIVRIGGPPADRASELYYFETPSIPAVETVERYLNDLQCIIADAEQQFSS